MGSWPSAELKPPGPRKARVAAALWWLLFALTAVAIVAAIWRSVAEYRSPTGFTKVGLVADVDPDGCVLVSPNTQAARAAWPKDIDRILGGCVIEVDGKSVASKSSRADVAAMLDGSGNAWVTVVLRESEGKLTRAGTFRRLPNWAWFDVSQFAAYALVSMLYAIVALVLRRRRPRDPVSSRISFAFVLMALIGPEMLGFWSSVGIGGVSYFTALVSLLLLITTFPAFPNGVYVPRAARWLRAAAPLTVVGIIAAIAYDVPDAVLLPIALSAIFLLPAAGLGLLLLRYFRMPSGLEKQQVKWAVFGLSAGLMILAVVAVADPVELAEADPLRFNWLPAIYDIATVLGFGLIPAGVGISLLGYRLNDADAAVSKSLGYVVVTLVVGVTWAIIDSVVRQFVTRLAGNPMATTAITTVMAALVIAPTRSYVLGWTEARFQPALVRLRALPGKLVRWQTCDTPEELAQAALADLVNGIGAAYAAVLGDDGREWRVLAADGIDPQTAAAQLAKERPGDRRQDPFPIRLELAEQLDKPDLLAIGPRSDGASFTRDERSAIAMIVEPLSNALQASALRERHVVKVEDSLAGIDHRLGKLERELTPAKKPRR